MKRIGTLSMAKRKSQSLDRAKIIAVYNQKGGCGKSQVSMQLAGTLSLRGYRVLVVDMDPQGTALMWSAGAPSDNPFPATVVSLSKQKESMVGEIRKFASNYDFILIDCPPAIESTVPWAALIIADLGLIPIIPLADNIWASKQAVNLGMNAKQENPNLMLRFVPSNVGRGNLYQYGLEAIKEIEEIEMLNTGLSHRNAFPTAAMLGTTVHGLANKSPAIDEIESLATAVLKLFNIKG